MNFFTMIKPASNNCNMNCTYCFYHDVSENRDISNYGIMREETMINIVKRSFEMRPTTATFAFQGGEPTLAGIGYFEKFIKAVSSFNTENIPVHYTLQTNGYAIDNTWAKLLKDNNFLVGVSLDGPASLHNKFRTDHNNKGTFNKVMQAIQILRKHDVSFNILTVINKQVAKHPDQIYKFLRKNKFDYLQFIPCLDPFDQSKDSLYSLEPKEYEYFMKRIFDLWHKDVLSGQFVSIRQFENLLSILSGNAPESCDMKGICSIIPTIEADGSVYPCDFFVLDEWRLGSLENHSFMELIQSDKAQSFIESSKNNHPECTTCNVAFLCRGGCRRLRVNDDLNHFCEAYKSFYPYAIPKLKEVLHYIRQ